MEKPENNTTKVNGKKSPEEFAAREEFKLELQEKFPNNPDSVDKYLDMKSPDETKMNVGRTPHDNLVRTRLKYVKRNREAVTELASSMAVDTIIQLFETLYSGDVKEEILKMPPQKKITFIKKCSEVYKALSGNEGVNVNVNTINSISEEEAKGFIDVNEESNNKTNGESIDVTEEQDGRRVNEDSSVDVANTGTSE